MIIHGTAPIESFDADKLYDVINTYVEADEVERALWILDNLPGKYRDFPPPQLVALKDQILRAMVTANAYGMCDLDSVVDQAKAAGFIDGLVRGKLALAEMKSWPWGDSHEPGEYDFPHIVDLGPGEYDIPLGLKEHVPFSYAPIYMDRKAYKAAVPYISSHLNHDRRDPQNTIFFALEVIEHLPSPMDLAIECQRHCGGWPARIHLSTPIYTYDGRVKHWRKPCGLPHLRTYTPREFVTEAMRIFPGYEAQHYHGGGLQSLRLMHPDYIDPNTLIDFKG